MYRAGSSQRRSSWGGVVPDRCLPTCLPMSPPGQTPLGVVAVLSMVPHVTPQHLGIATQDLLAEAIRKSACAVDFGLWIRNVEASAGFRPAGRQVFRGLQRRASPLTSCGGRSGAHASDAGVTSRAKSQCKQRPPLCFLPCCPRNGSVASAASSAVSAPESAIPWSASVAVVVGSCRLAWHVVAL